MERNSKSERLRSRIGCPATDAAALPSPPPPTTIGLTVSPIDLPWPRHHRAAEVATIEAPTRSQRTIICSPDAAATSPPPPTTALIALATSPSESPQPGDHHAAEFAAIGAMVGLHALLSVASTSPLSVVRGGLSGTVFGGNDCRRSCRGSFIRELSFLS